MNIVSMLENAGRERPEEVALVDDGGRRLTYAQWLSRARRLAAGIRAEQIDPSRSLLAFRSADALDYAAALFGVIGAGGAGVPVGLPAPAAAIDRMAEQVGATTLLASDTVDAGIEARPVGALLAAGEADLVDDFAPEDPAQILFSSGTTGLPKAVVVPHGNLAWVPANWRQPGERREQLVHAFPLGASAFQSQVFRSITLQLTVRMLSIFVARRLVHILESTDVTTLVLAPAMVSLLLEELNDGRRFPSVESIGMTGSFPRPGDQEALGRAFPSAIVLTSYGSTEASPAGTSGPFDPERPFHVGRPNRGCQVRITDDADDELPPGEVGTVWMRAVGATSRRYLDDDEANAHHFREGWTRMGDVGYVAEDGSLVLVGRATDVISVGGLKVSIPEVEAVISRCPGVRDVAAFPYPHDVLSQVVAVEVVRSSDVSEAEIVEFARARLVRHAVPAHCLFVDEIKRNAMGKAIRREIRGRGPR